MLEQSSQDKAPTPTHPASDYFALLRKQVDFGNVSTTSNPLSLVLTLPSVCCAANGGSVQQAAILDRAWNLLRKSATILDDVEDNDLDVTAWINMAPEITTAAQARGIATNIATGLLIELNSLLVTLPEQGCDLETAAAIQQAFSRTIMQMCVGQHKDLSIPEPTLEQSWTIAENKSGSCFALPCWAGTRLATNDQTKLEKAHELGYQIGMLIQIKDDLSDLWPQENKASDLHDKKGWSLPIAYAMTVLPQEEQEQLHQYLKLASEDKSAETAAREIIVSSGAGLFLALKAKTCRLQAEAALTQLTDDELYSEQLRKLIQAIDFVDKQ